MVDVLLFAYPDIENKSQDKFHCSVGIMAFNEEANIAKTLQAVLDQKTTTCSIDEVIVVASGCTDNTETIVRSFCDLYPQVTLLVEKCREGKASAVNLFLSHVSNNILIAVGADTIPAPDALQRLVEPFIDPEVGMTGGHPIPINDPDRFMGFAVHLLWELHHQIALKTPKLGEMTAYRKIFQRIPVRSSVDEAAMEPLIRGQGYKLRYVPEAIVFNRGPETVKDFLKQRRRIYAGHLQMRRKQGYQVSTMSGLNILPALLRAWKWDWQFIYWMPFVVLLEAYGRLLGWVDFNFKKQDHAIWERVETTKVL